MNANVKTNIQSDNNIIDINISGIGKKRIRVNGDDNKILLLNTNDNNITVRFTEAYPKLKEWEQSFKELGSLQSNKEEDIDIDALTVYAKKIKETDNKMRESLDYIFNSSISEICDDGGSMYDILDGGVMRWESILTALLGLYSETISKNSEKIMKRMNQHTSKYTKA